MTLADMMAIGNYSCQAEGDRKLMGQPLVHSQRLGSLMGVFGQDSIWSNLALNAKIAEIVSSQWG